MHQTELKIAFHSLIKSEIWTAEEIYLKNLFYALRKIYKKEAQLYLLTPSFLQNIENYINNIQPDATIFYNLPSRWTILWFLNVLTKRLFSFDIFMGKTLRKHKINVLFGQAITHKYPYLAILSWLPDFQHLHFPEMFNNSEILIRNRTFLKSARLSSRIILPTETAKRDFESFAPKYVYKARVLHPISYIPQSIYETRLDSIVKLYALPEKFIYLPNQFWKHKNHEIAFEAIKILRDQGSKIFIVCTGSSLDYRHPTYFVNLFQKLSQWNIKDQVAYLGLIPHEHVLLLIRQSICVLNPSIFEGWGITVDEARSVGKQVLLSDIPAHREQNPPRAIFFNPKDSEELAYKLKKIWFELSPGPDKELEIEARQNLSERIIKFAKTFMSIVKEVNKF